MSNSTDVPSLLFFVIINSLMLILIVIGVIFGLIVIILISTHKNNHTVPNSLSCNSCSGGLFYFCVYTVFIIYEYLPEKYRTNPLLCQLQGYMYSVSCCAVTYSYLVQATNRLFYALFYKYRFLLSSKSACILIVIHWSLSFILPFPIIFLNGYQYQIESQICILTTKQFPTAMYGVAAFFFVPLSSVIGIYTIILHNACQRTKRYASRAIRKRHHATVYSRRSSRDLKVIRHTVILIGILTVGGTPYCILIILDVLNAASPEWYLLVTLFITFSVMADMIVIFAYNKSCINIIYKPFKYEPSLNSLSQEQLKEKPNSLISSAYC
ncbi:unnamed protein product [Didymodactylos carnosus]|uniref:G-protein coupled receptors family 1 profile domain-containing protein n=1 Tax=Didymodactylos carnosus TaxID=1234261 RepID=A0A814C998_9BILA|nr:unnamed protein product [Didymodactylos carnosus]CAF0938463.1 unnamed protein product [Didymodactylos carnosus]CAF3544932.1 unnamed protein product [Didymodactylos carnosus]CAF3715311.1 unnamed protein product [Didymodactylos carnosus]